MSKTQMSDSVKVTAMILGTIILFAIVGGIFYFQANPSQTVNSNGNAVINAVPDLVSVYFVIEAKAETAQEANALNSEIKAKMLTELASVSGLGFDNKDLTTESYSVNEDCQWTGSGQKCNGYVANHYLKLELKEDKMDFAGAVIDAGINAGANLNYVNFELSREKQNEYKAQALKEATKDAKSKAEGIALGLGMRVGKVVSVASNDFGYSPWNIYGAATMDSVSVAKEAVANIQPGEREISGSVQVIYALI